MIRRREFIAGISVAALGSVAGCLDLVTGDGVELEAQPAAVSEDAQSSAGYEHDDREAIVFEETVEAAGESRDVTVTSWVGTYSRSPDDVDVHESDAGVGVDGDDGAVFAVISSPSESIAGYELNPIYQMDDEEWLERFSEHLVDDGLEDIELEDEYAIRMLDESVTLHEFSAVMDVEGYDVDVALYTASVSHEGDVVIALGAHPAVVDERESMETLAEGVVHPLV